MSLPPEFWLDMDNLRKVNRKLDNARQSASSYQTEADKYAQLAAAANAEIGPGEAELEALIKKLNGYFTAPESLPTGGEGTDPKEGG